MKNEIKNNAHGKDELTRDDVATLVVLARQEKGRSSYDGSLEEHNEHWNKLIGKLNKMLKEKNEEERN